MKIGIVSLFVNCVADFASQSPLSCTEGKITTNWHVKKIISSKNGVQKTAVLAPKLLFFRSLAPNLVMGLKNQVPRSMGN